MTATRSRVIRKTILARVSKVDKEANPVHAVVTWETRVNKVVPAEAANKGNREAHPIAGINRVNKDNMVNEARKARKGEFHPIVAVLLH